MASLSRSFPSRQLLSLARRTEIRAVATTESFPPSRFLIVPSHVSCSVTHREARTIHSSSSNRASPPEGITLDPALSTPPGQQGIQPSKMAKTAPLAVLPLTNILRSLMTTTITSSPLLLRPSLAILSVLANSSSPWLNPDHNAPLRFLLKKTFYAQFCAGENPAEVRQTMDMLRKIGFSGVIMGYAREVVLTDMQTKGLASSLSSGTEAEELVRKEIDPWAKGTTETIQLAQPGDYVAVKFTGAGRQALYALSTRQAPSPALAAAIDGICQLAAQRGVRLLFDAEQQAVQAGIDDWTLDYMRKYNTPDRAIIYGTYQAYLKGTPVVLSRHLAVASREGFALGVKLVRGAYLGSDPRHLMHDTKADTDAAYDGIAAALLRRQWSPPLRPPSQEDGSKHAPSPSPSPPTSFPTVNMVLASHNADSVRKARMLMDAGECRTEVAFAQLQGMADEVSCELVACRAPASDTTADDKTTATVPQAYKYLVWGSTGDCMKYLLRRAEENRDAVQRTRSGRDAMRAELLRRVRSLFGMA